MADNHDGEIGGRIVGPVMVQRLAASGARVSHLEIAAEHGAFGASRTAEPGASQKRKQDRALASRSRVAASDARADRGWCRLHPYSLAKFCPRAKSDPGTRPLAASLFLAAPA